MLLDPDEIKNDKSQSANQSQKLITALNEEEAKLNREVSLLKTASEDEKLRIKTETDEYVARETLRKETLEKEVIGLETRRAEALKPIIDVRAEADTYLADAKATLARAERKEALVDEKHEENMDLAETLKDRESDVGSRETKVTSREEMVTVEESRLKDSSNALADKWVVYHSTTTRVNTDFENREKRITAREKTLDIRQGQLDERDKFQTGHVRQIRDKYATLGRAVDEARKKYNVKI